MPTSKHFGYINILHRSSAICTAILIHRYWWMREKERKSSRRLLGLAPLASAIQLPSTTLAAWISTRIFIRRTSRTGYPIAPSKLTISSLPLIGMTQFFRKYRVMDTVSFTLRVLCFAPLCFQINTKIHTRAMQNLVWHLRRNFRPRHKPVRKFCIISNWRLATK